MSMPRFEPYAFLKSRSESGSPNPPGQGSGSGDPADREPGLGKIRWRLGGTTPQKTARLGGLGELGGGGQSKNELDDASKCAPSPPGRSDAFPCAYADRDTMEISKASAEADEGASPPNSPNPPNRQDFRGVQPPNRYLISPNKAEADEARNLTTRVAELRSARAT